MEKQIYESVDTIDGFFGNSLFSVGDVLAKFLTDRLGEVKFVNTGTFLDLAGGRKSSYSTTFYIKSKDVVLYKLGSFPEADTSAPYAHKVVLEGDEIAVGEVERIILEHIEKVKRERQEKIPVGH